MLRKMGTSKISSNRDDNLILLTEMSEIRNRIHSLCEKCECPRLSKCRKVSNVCTAPSVQRRKVEHEGGDFVRYLYLRSRIVEANYAFILRKACSFGCNKETVPELIQEGVLAVTRAADMFDIGRGTSFLTYAYHHIRKRMSKFVRDNHLVRNKGYVQHIIKGIRQIYNRLEQEINTSQAAFIERGPITIDLLISEIKKRSNRKTQINYDVLRTWLEPEYYTMVMESRYATVSNGNGNGDKPVEDIEIQSIKNSGFYDVMNRTIDEELDEFPMQMAEAVRMKFGIGNYDRPMSLAEIGAVLGISHQAVSTLIRKFYKCSSKIKNKIGRMFPIVDL